MNNVEQKQQNNLFFYLFVGAMGAGLLAIIGYLLYGIFA